MFCAIVARVTRVSAGCRIELRLMVLAVTEKDAGTELRCVTQNRAGRQEVVTHLQLEGRRTAPPCGASLFERSLASRSRRTPEAVRRFLMAAHGCRLRDQSRNNVSTISGCFRVCRP